MSGTRAIKRALVSVYDKTGLAELARGLHAAGVEIVSTGSTAAVIAEAGAQVTKVEELTGFPECLEGRVKTLHPRVHAGILADTRKPAHLDQLDELEIAPFDLVVVNLYPFSETVASGAGFDDCVEQIDIGGPSMVRAAAKNHPSVTVITDPADYDAVLAAATGEGFDLEARRRFAARAFAHTAAYDTAVASWFAAELAVDAPTEAGQPAAEALRGPDFAGLTGEKIADLRYGENPHQAAAVYADGTRGIAGARLLGGKAMSYNNYTDTDAAIRAAYDFDRPAVAIIKHANPCGIAVADTAAAAHRAAHECDPLSAYGGVIATNREVDAELAESIAPIFTECLAAPAFSAEALEILSAKKNLRLLELGEIDVPARDLTPITGGFLVQDRDRLQAAGDSPENWTLAAGRPAAPEVLADLDFAWRACRAVKSNAILIARDSASVGVGMGQVNRVDSARLAVERAGTERTAGAVAASDAFFPFADGLQILIDAGVTAVVQPGGSIRDDEVIAAAEAAGVTLYLTGSRHFFH
ncbi:phosphoribosylaminoimidazolecarboxamide formyltransferase/IMP cyclohydrolase [Brevibacterium sanguinis]|uniref:Bifunctional purine biosynthesis protein PurH n=2 Tax=Brevibacterium TaxID=1696 RepID=A0A366IG42_9MICO|nr:MULTISPECIES: bifunctional phosphoribosylaminoimidazolecarboxamide formyltransferase/IMP cyclohydrolase [Brevibacterium]RBP63684.1 phosphoribosylaminoimidazolecarboxamide formyltransferase/IMP cyclohydrolase [Brevibacterium sanguinis]RBP70343.1 phosphoribosylaminoimidazolecarboxamide formyltransferase/IMP cyclohydrolase [Brevibacterium celere]